jgi:hypothetical protein
VTTLSRKVQDAGIAAQAGLDAKRLHLYATAFFI